MPSVSEHIPAKVIMKNVLKIILQGISASNTLNQLSKYAFLREKFPLSLFLAESSNGLQNMSILVTAKYVNLRHLNVLQTDYTYALFLFRAMFRKPVPYIITPVLRNISRKKKHASETYGFVKQLFGRLSECVSR